MCMVCHHTLHEGWMLSSRLEVQCIREKPWCSTRLMSVAGSLHNYFPKMKYVVFNRVTMIVDMRRVQLHRLGWLEINQKKKKKKEMIKI